MNRAPIRLGPMALLLAVIATCLSVLAILAFSTARADLSLAERYAGTVWTRYELEKQGMEFLEDAGPGAEAEFEEDGMTLRVALDGDGNVCRWTMEKAWQQNDTIEDLWSGE